jgi:hypothetical protein
MMAVPPTAPETAADRLDRVLDQLESGNHRFERLRNNFPSFKKLFLVISLAFISWYATYIGMLELITANTGPIPLGQEIAIGFAVMTLMAMVLYILDSLFSPISWWLRILYIGGYIFLTLISVGFEFGFFWKVLESRAEATRSAESAIGQVQQALEQGKVRLAELGATLDSLTTLSAQKAVEERLKGGTCPDSPPGNGPRRKMRDQDAKDFAYTASFIKSRSAGIQTDLNALNVDLNKVLSRDPSTFDPKTGTRNAFLSALNRKLDLTVTRFNTLRTDPQLAVQRDALAKRAAETSFPDGSGGTFSCPDPQLQTALKGAVAAIDGLPVIHKTDIEAVEGSEAVVEAFRRLTTTFIGALHFKLPPSPDELRERQRQAVQTAENPQAQAELTEVQAGLGPRDYIPLCVALFVDFCLLLVSINRPINRFQHLLSTLRDARGGPVGEILSRFHDSHQQGLGKEFEVFQHAVFDFLGDYYVAVPLNARRADALYLANLFVGLEGKGIIDRAMLPPTAVIRRKLRLQGSAFAEEPAFRLYRFRNGAWSKLVLEAILGKPFRRAEAPSQRQAADRSAAPAGTDAPAADGPVQQANGHAVMETAEPMPQTGAEDQKTPENSESVFRALPPPAGGNGRRPPEI